MSRLSLDGLTPYQQNVLRRVVGEVDAGRLSRDELAAVLHAAPGDVLPRLDVLLRARR